jgi:hypothetical protein
LFPVRVFRAMEQGTRERLKRKRERDRKGRKFEKLLFFLLKGPSTLAFLASVSPSAKVPLPNCFLCFITYVIAQEKQRKHLGSGAIADGETDAKNASVDGP